MQQHELRGRWWRTLSGSGKWVQVRPSEGNVGPGESRGECSEVSYKHQRKPAPPAWYADHKRETFPWYSTSSAGSFRSDQIRSGIILLKKGDFFRLYQWLNKCVSVSHRLTAEFSLEMKALSREASIHHRTHTRVQHQCLPLRPDPKIVLGFCFSHPVTLMREWSSPLAEQHAVVAGRDERRAVHGLRTRSCVGKLGLHISPWHVRQKKK